MMEQSLPTLPRKPRISHGSFLKMFLQLELYVHVDRNSKLGMTSLRERCTRTFAID